MKSYKILKGFCASVAILMVCAAGACAFAGAAVDLQRQAITLVLPVEPPTLNSLRATDKVSYFLLSHLQDGLVQYDEHNKLAPAIATHWELDGTKATFWLRKDARWHDGSPVTAKDFVYAWQQAVRPETGARYVSLFFPIKNAEQIHLGQLPVPELGVQAVGDYQLQVEFARPCPYFVSLTAFMAYYPIHRETYERFGVAYGTDANKMAFNGPFLLDDWKHGASLRLRKNPDYWASNSINLEEINIPYITSDAGAAFNLFRNQGIAMTQLNNDWAKVAMQEKLRIQRFATGTLFFLQFNLRPGQNGAKRSLRQAIQGVIDPQYLVDKVLAQPGIRPASSLYPSYMQLAGESLTDFAQAKKQVSRSPGNKTLGHEKTEYGNIRLRLLVSDVPSANQIAEYLQFHLKEALNLDVIIERQTFKQRLQQMRAGDFEMALSSWGPDFDDPLTFADLFASWNPNNRGQYKNKEYDQWVALAQESTDLVSRRKAFEAMHSLIREDVVIIPLYENAELWVHHPQLQGVGRSVFAGDPNFRRAGLVAD